MPPRHTRPGPVYIYIYVYTWPTELYGIVYETTNLPPECGSHYIIVPKSIFAARGADCARRASAEGRSLTGAGWLAGLVCAAWTDLQRLIYGTHWTRISISVAIARQPEQIYREAGWLAGCSKGILKFS